VDHVKKVMSLKHGDRQITSKSVSLISHILHK